MHTHPTVVKKHIRNRDGITVIEVLIVIAVIALLVAILLPAVQRSRETARRIQCSNHLKQIGTGLHNYESNYGVFPGSLYSWEIAILPYIEQTAVSRRIQDYREGKTDYHNAMAGISVPVYICPSDPFAVEQKGWIPSYLMNDGYWPKEYLCNGFYRVYKREKYSPNDFSPWEDCRQLAARDITDGLSTTAALSEKLIDPPPRYTVEAGLLPQQNPQVWNRYIRETWITDASPDQMEQFARKCEFEPIKPLNEYLSWGNNLGLVNDYYYHHLLPPNRSSCLNGSFSFADGLTFTANSLHQSGVNLLLADGAVRFFSDLIDVQVWRGIGSRNGEETVSF